MKKKLALIILLLISQQAVAASNQKNWNTFTEIGAYGLVGLALIKPAYHRDWQGLTQAGLSVIAASATGLVGKALIDEPRPDYSDNDSFPSNHTANAFAAATTLHIRYGWEIGFPAYGIATLVGIGRVQAYKHHWRDVLAGAVIGSVSGWLLTDKLNENIQLTPWATSNSIGMSVALNW